MTPTNETWIELWLTTARSANCKVFSRVHRTRGIHILNFALIDWQSFSPLSFSERGAPIQWIFNGKYNFYCMTSKSEKFRLSVFSHNLWLSQFFSSELVLQISKRIFVRIDCWKNVWTSVPIPWAVHSVVLRPIISMKYSRKHVFDKLNLTLSPLNKKVYITSTEWIGNNFTKYHNQMLKPCRNNQRETQTNIVDLKCPVIILVVHSTLNQKPTFWTSCNFARVTCIFLAVLKET